MKDFDTFSFQPNKKSGRSSQPSQKEIQPPLVKWNQLQYRLYPQTYPQPPALTTQMFSIEKIQKDNVMRRIQLEQKLTEVQRRQKQERVRNFMKHQNVQTDKDHFQNLVKVAEKAQKVELVIQPPLKFRQQSLIIEKSVKIPSQTKVQNLFRKITFPELPSSNLEKLGKECEQLYSQFQHSDVNYLLMVVNFHLGRFEKVREQYRQIVTYKIFQKKAHWVAAEAEFQLQNYEFCIKIADRCMKYLGEQHLPRFIYLQARCYFLVGSFVSSLLCYDQLVKIRPNVAEHYLERGILKNKMGYPRQAHQEFVTFGVIQPHAADYLREKIRNQKEFLKKKELTAALQNLT